MRVIQVPYNSPAMHEYLEMGWTITSVHGSVVLHEIAAVSASAKRKAAQRKYDKTRAPGVLIRFSQWELDNLDALRRPGESRQTAIKRIVFGGIT